MLKRLWVRNGLVSLDLWNYLGSPAHRLNVEHGEDCMQDMKPCLKKASSTSLHDLGRRSE